MARQADLVLRVHRFLHLSLANGPGARAVIWVQGCSLHCPGCFNPATHPVKDGEAAVVSDLFQQIADLGEAIEGLTVGGGEPLQQRRALMSLLRLVKRETQLSVLVLTGYSWEEVQRMPQIGSLLECIDVLIAGRYDQNQRLANGLRGSSNKSIHFLTDRYAFDDLADVPAAEVFIMPDGDVMVSGIDPLEW